MFESDIIEETQKDLEKGIHTPDVQSTVNGGLEPPLNEARREITHTDKELLDRAREINSSGKFIFTCFSEMNTFLLLRSQQEILKLQNRLHDSIEGKGTWTDADSDDLQKKLSEYRMACGSSQLIVDGALDMQKTILTWEHPPFKISHSAGEFLFGKSATAPPLHLTSYAFPSAIAFGPAAQSTKDFDGSDYVDLCPQNSTPINHFLRKVLPQHFGYSAADGKVIAYLQSQNEGNPIWRGSSASIAIISRVLISVLSVILLIVPMCALTYIQPTGYILLTASLFSLVFALIAAVSSNARTHEVFGITAAYAAVLMVFVGNAIQNNHLLGSTPS